MKKLLAIFLAVVFLVSLTAHLLAGGYESSGLGGRAVSMGGAYIGASCDWTSVYWNPGGLPDSEREWGLSAYVPYYTVYDGNSVKNFDLTNYSLDQADIFMRIYPTEPGRFDKKGFSKIVVNPGLGLVWPLPNDFALAVASYVPVGQMVDWEDDSVKDPVTGAAIDAKYYNMLGLLVNNLSLAKRFNEYFSIGAGINCIYGIQKVDAEKQYIVSPGSALNYAFDYEMDMDGWGFEGVVGVKVNPIERLSIGAVYRTGGKVDFSGDAYYSHTTTGIRGKSNVSSDFYHPASYGIGLAYNIKPQWLVTLDWAQTDWTRTKTKLDFDSPGAALINLDADSDWKRSNRYKIGTEYILNDRWCLRGGYFYDERAVPDKGVSITGCNDVTKNHLSLGVGYRVNQWLFDLGYEYSWGKEDIDDVTYKMAMYSLLVGITYRF